jgi:hypothetical protein
LRQARKHWQGETVPSAKKGVSGKLKDGLTTKSSREAERHEDRTRIETDADDLHRQVDTEDFVFTERQTVSARAVAPPSRKRLSADADANPSQSGIHRIDRTARDEIEGHRCRVFLDPPG